MEESTKHILERLLPALEQIAVGLACMRDEVWVRWFKSLYRQVHGAIVSALADEGRQDLADSLTPTPDDVEKDHLLASKVGETLRAIEKEVGFARAEADDDPLLVTHRRLTTLRTISTRKELAEVAALDGFLCNVSDRAGGKAPVIHRVSCSSVQHMLDAHPGILSEMKVWAERLQELVKWFRERKRHYSFCSFCHPDAVVEVLPPEVALGE